MSVNLIRYATDTTPAWGVVHEGAVLPLLADYVSTADVLGEGVKVARSLLAHAGAGRRPLDGLRLLHPVPGARIVCQGANYRRPAPA
ncbi:MAG TPA: hypothetical protein VE733_00860 [Streptosporangiaceae bacterium]|nr:hypothetical protein [Streptosporangiaceae bacterium]